MYVALETGSSSLWRESYWQLVFFLIEKHIVNLYGLIIHGLIRTFVWIAGLKYLKLLSEISRVNFINLNALYKLSVAKRRGSCVVGRSRGCESWVWVWVNVVGKKGIEKNDNKNNNNKQKKFVKYL